MSMNDNLALDMKSNRNLLGDIEDLPGYESLMKMTSGPPNKIINDDNFDDYDVVKITKKKKDDDKIASLMASIQELNI